MSVNLSPRRPSPSREGKQVIYASAPLNQILQKNIMRSSLCFFKTDRAARLFDLKLLGF